MKLTSGGAIQWGGSILKSWSSTKTTIVLSSAEAELYAMSKCAQHVASLLSIASDFGIELNAVHSDATASLGIASGEFKVQHLWIQVAVGNNELKIEKVGSLGNPAYMLAKFMAKDAHSEHACKLNLSFEREKSSLDKAAEALMGLVGLEALMIPFTKHAAPGKTPAAAMASTLENPADVLVKFMAKDAHSKHACKLNLSCERAAEALIGLVGLEAWMKLFAKHAATGKTPASTVAPFSLRT